MTAPGSYRLGLRWIAGIVVAVGLSTVALAVWVYLASESRFRSVAAPPAFFYPVPDDPVALERGQHLVQTRGCAGCHGEDLAGQVMWGTAVSVNLPDYARAQSAATFEAALRHGIGRDGNTFYSMPSYNFKLLRDADVADMYAYLRSLPVTHKKLPRAHLPWTVRLDLARGKDVVIAEVVNRVPVLQRSNDVDPRIARGEYIAMTTCNECHGLSLRADVPWSGETAPDLLIIMAYDEGAFRTLMRTGKALGDRELPMMSGVARGRFAHFTDQEVEDVYTFLRDMAARASASARE